MRGRIGALMFWALTTSKFENSLHENTPQFFPILLFSLYVLQEDLLIHGDSVYDIIDKQDHASIQAQLMNRGGGGTEQDSNPRTGGGGGGGGGGASPEHNPPPPSSEGGAKERRIFLCRMNVSRNSRRQMRFGDQVRKRRRKAFRKKGGFLAGLSVGGLRGRNFFLWETD